MKSSFLLAACLTLVSLSTAAVEPSADHTMHEAKPTATDPHLVIDSPADDQLITGQVVVIRFHTEGLRILPVYGPDAARVVPRIGHLHVTVDDNQWHWAEASTEPIVLQGLPDGSHTVKIELADPTHKILETKVVRFRTALPQQ